MADGDGRRGRSESMQRKEDLPTTVRPRLDLSAVKEQGSSGPTTPMAISPGPSAGPAAAPLARPPPPAGPLPYNVVPAFVAATAAGSGAGAGRWPATAPWAVAMGYAVPVAPAAPPAAAGAAPAPLGALGVARPGVTGATAVPAATVLPASFQPRAPPAAGAPATAAAPAPAAAAAPPQRGQLPLMFYEVDADALVELTAENIDRIIAHNDQLPFRIEDVTRFHARAAANITVRDYLRRFVQFCALERCCILAILVYMDRLRKSNARAIVSSITVHRIIITAIVVATKTLCDSYYTNDHYAKIGGITMAELNVLELEMLLLLDWRLSITPETLQQYYVKLVRSSHKFAPYARLVLAANPAPGAPPPPPASAAGFPGRSPSGSPAMQTSPILPQARPAGDAGSGGGGGVGAGGARSNGAAPGAAPGAVSLRVGAAPPAFAAPVPVSGAAAPMASAFPSPSMRHAAAGFAGVPSPTVDAVRAASASPVPQST